MHNISMKQALSIWSELWRAYYGENGFGSDTAEIYAYTVIPHTPTLQANGFAEAKNEAGLQAAQSLYSLLVEFSKESGCKIEVDGRKMGEWFAQEPFQHRCHVRVFK